MSTTPLLRLPPPQKTLRSTTLFTHPLKLNTLSTSPPSLHPNSVQSRRLPPPISASYNTTPVPDRLISAAAYFFPFFNGLQYGRFLFAQYPNTLGLILNPFLPLLSFYRSVPYSSYLAFLILYIGVVRNSNVSRYARFNAMQAVVLDVLLVLPMLVQRIFNPGPHGIGGKIVMWSHSVIFVAVLACFVYTFGYAVMGRTPKLPFVGDAADRQF
ncbi:protein TIC 20-II, chloroplastic-like isoform X2 [Bidens hawaiensis]|uniref:protein TIC 20-II, chloroplastic-like isoform X2 n=1 Tax=Bidens hawaiensis TaxID=980011 RepID=UPI004049877D